MFEHVGQGSKDCPIFASIARRERSACRHLDAALGIHIGRGFFRISSAWQNHIGPRGSAVAMSSDVNDEGSRRDLDFLLYEWLRVDELTKRERFAEHSRETFDAAVDASLQALGVAA